MNFTVKINDSETKAKSIINMLKELAKDYSFISITEDKTDLSEDIVQELDARHAYMEENPNEWKSWEEVKNNLLGQ